ncbi:Zn-ribbon domain-containing OB-fold protein [Pararhodobacter aggregans]|uniref:DNA-binding protein n=1 Tax=Pararhodobacter aggregans TaxID=404875 RepID=A0A2T7UM18_9RHOB|nr:OB-fold domain-containing protein [Pararhodobacter aggregans]PTW99987.1 hypothetical protein C8N33_11273 [Pararhodobacter aggregans]PVE45743.1 DNA-binding protein [Pararhodobacter aggregans]
MSPAAFPRPDIDDLSAPYWEALGKGHLLYQRCLSCGTAWLPARSQCPGCLGPDIGWVPASGGAKLISWVVYHRAFNPAFEDRVPYNVAVVELDEGPRLISNVVGLDPEQEICAQLHLDQPLRLAIRHEQGVAIPAFLRAPE